MGTCGSKGVETAELIEIRTCLNKQNESIQSLIHSTQNELKSINDKINKIESQITNILIKQEDNCKIQIIAKNEKVEEEVKDLKHHHHKPKTIQLSSQNKSNKANNNYNIDIDSINVKMQSMRNLVRKRMSL